MNFHDELKLNMQEYKKYSRLPRPGGQAILNIHSTPPIFK